MKRIGLHAVLFGIVLMVAIYSCFEFEPDRGTMFFHGFSTGVCFIRLADAILLKIIEKGEN